MPKQITQSSIEITQVELAGPANHSTSPRSIMSPLRGSQIWRKVATLAAGSVPHSARSASPAAGPDTRMTAMAALPGPLASAQIVSVLEFIDLRIGSSCRSGDGVRYPTTTAPSDRSDDARSAHQ